MPTTQVILNGDFSNSTNNSAANWTGNDIETRNSNTYLPGTNAAQGRVAEINGGAGQTTVLEQTFTLTQGYSGDLSFDFALRSTAGGATAGVDGFRVEILDASGTVIFTQEIFPTVEAYQTFTADVDFPAAGDYTLRFTELDDGADGRGAILDNVSLLVCFGDDTLITTPTGSVRAGDLAVGDMVTTESGPKPVRWVARRHVTAADIASDERYAPVRISKEALGAGLPKRDFWVSRQHRLLVSSKVAEKMFGTTEVLLPAIRLTSLPGIDIDTSVEAIDYVHILLDRHEILFAEGAPAESMLLGEMAVGSLTPAGFEELRLIFPDLLAIANRIAPAHVIPERARQKRLVERLDKNDRPVLECYPSA